MLRTCLLGGRIPSRGLFWRPALKPAWLKPRAQAPKKELFDAQADHPSSLPTRIVPLVTAQKHVARRVYRFDMRGNFELAKFSKTMANQMRLQPRDLRTVELHQNQFGIYARRNAILINMLSVKGIVQCNTCVIYDPADTNIMEYVEYISARIRSDGDTEMIYHPYEFQALEAILDIVVHELRHKLDGIRPDVQAVLSLLEETQTPTFDRSVLRDLLFQSKRLTRFEQQARDVQSVLDDILDSDEDMAQMYLTTKAQTGHPRRMDQHDEVEIIFENCLKQVDEIVRDASQLRAFIKDTEDVININLDSQRNEMMRLELQLTMGTFSAALSSLIAAFFGMNLTSHIEENSFAFVGVSAMCITLFWGSMWALWRRGARHRMW